MNLIERQAAIDTVDEALTGVFVEHRDIAEKMINKIPSVQPEIIRCKECVYSHMTYDGDCKYCDKWGEIYESGESLYLEGDFFCGFGERKTDD